MRKCFVCEEEKSGCQQFAEDFVKGGVWICPEDVRHWIFQHLDGGGWLDDLEVVDDLK